MYTEITEIIVNHKTKDLILKNWKSAGINLLNSEIIDEPEELSLMLNVPMKIRGGESNLLIPCKLVFSYRKIGFSLKLLCVYTKPLVISFVVGILISILFYSLYRDLIAVVLMFIFSLAFTFLILYFAILKRANSFLKELKIKYK